MTKSLRVALLMMSVLALALPARAIEIGLVGGDYDPPDITDPNTFSFFNCNEALEEDPFHPTDPRLKGFFCIFYGLVDFMDEGEGDIGEDGIDSILSLDIILTKLGIPVTTEDVFINPEGPSAMQIVDTSTIHSTGLSLFAGKISPETCIPEGGGGPIEGCQIVNAVALFIGPGDDENFNPDDYQSRNIGVNGVRVAEPATLFLLAPAAALLMRRARRRKN